MHTNTAQYGAVEELRVGLICWGLYMGPLIPLCLGEMTEVKQT